MKKVIFGLLALLIVSGCTGRDWRMQRQILENPSEEYLDPEPDANETRATGALYDVSAKEGKHKLAKEPYAIGSKQKDPELLGPQRTIEKADTVVDTVSTNVVTEDTASKPKPTISKMTKIECISLIGVEKFDRYSKRFGGEAGAIKRCTVIKRLRG